MRLSSIKQKHIGNITSKCNIIDHCNDFSSLSLSNLPNLPLNSKFDFIEFSFLFMLLDDSTVRQRINCSRITEQFWKKIKCLDEFLNTFNLGEKEMLKIYKYIQYFKTSKYQKEMVLKSFFYLKENKIIDYKSSLADISKELQKILKKISRKNAKLSEDIKVIKCTNILYYYYEPWNKDSAIRLRLSEKYLNENFNTESNIQNSTTNSYILDNKTSSIAQFNKIELVELNITSNNNIENRNFFIMDSFQKLNTCRVFEVLKTIYDSSSQKSYNSYSSNNILSDFILNKKSSTVGNDLLIKAFNVNDSRECIKSYISKFKQSK
jgi:hypothetical protein